MRTLPRLGIICVGMAVLLGCDSAKPRPIGGSSVGSSPTGRLPTGIGNCRIVGPKLLSGAEPHGESAFRALADAGVKVIVSVDGAAPDVAAARRVGIRYVHLPISYDTVPAAVAERIAQLTHTTAGKVFVHCKHGKHRGPSAAMTARRLLDPTCSAEEASAFLREAGTDPTYRGLFAAVVQARPLPSDTLQRVPTDLPESAEVDHVVTLMVAIDAAWSRLKTAPPTVSEEMRQAVAVLVKLYRELAEQPPPSARDPKFQELLRPALADVVALQRSLDSADPEERRTLLTAIGRQCSACHKVLRDNRSPSAQALGN